MSLFAAAPMASDWPSFRLGQRSNVEQEELGLGLGYGRIQTSSVETRPPLRSHKSFPHTLGTSNYAAPHCASPLSQVANPGAEESTPRPTGEGMKSTPAPPELTVQTSFGGSAPVSPAAQLTPTSQEADQDEHLVDDEDDSMAAEGSESAVGGDCESQSITEKTAAERRAEKRKMKRFRLTHNQTRYLMSEFARQAHPDAAQRERLAREIPGLSSRQVQVWFQNRRAKLKRLTTDDRERMMKSRALPEDFDMSQALQSPFGNAIPHHYSQNYSTPMASPGAYASSYESAMIRPLMVNGLRRESEDESNISPVSMSSAFGSYYTPPGSVPTSENMSPISPTSERTALVNPSFSQSSPRSANPFSTRSSSFSSNFPSHPSIPRLQLHDRVSRPRAESLASPLRTSMSYTGNLDYATHSTEDHIQTSQAGSLGSSSRVFSIGEPSVSRGFNFNPGFQSSALARPHPNIATFPPGLNLHHPYRPLLPFSSFQTHGQSASHEQSSLSNSSHISQHSPLPSSTAQQSMAYSSAPLAPPGEFQIPASTELYHSYADHHEELPGHSSSEQPLELESYYKSEPERRNMGMASRHGHPGRIFSPPMSAHTQGPPTPQTSGIKRRRDSGSREGDDDGLNSDFVGGNRRRSFTLPSGYGS